MIGKKHKKGLRMVVKHITLMIMVMMHFAGLSAMRCEQTQSEKSLVAQWTEARTDAHKALAISLQTPEMKKYNAIKYQWTTPEEQARANTAYTNAFTTPQHNAFQQAYDKEFRLRMLLSDKHGHLIDGDYNWEPKS